MLFVFLTVLIMAAVAYVQFREGVFTAFCMLVNVMIASIVTCNFFEPIANLLGGMTSGTFMDGIEDFVAMILVFSITLGLLRWATNSLASTEIEYHPLLYQGGAILCGMLTGYILMGFFVVAMQTLPLHENFMGFEAEITTDPSYGYLHHLSTASPDKRESASEKKGTEALRRIFPPDRIWLAMMQRASYGSLGSDRQDRKGFDAGCNFPLRYERYRRYGDPTVKPDAKPWDDVVPPRALK